MEIIRATKLHEQAGAYYVRIQAMARQHHITLEEEFDEYDTPDTKYIVILDDNFPVATCRLLCKDDAVAEIGRVVVLEEYRGKGLGRSAVTEAELWLKDLGYKRIIVNSRDSVVGFYERLGYKMTDKPAKTCTPFVCVEMEKETEHGI